MKNCQTPHCRKKAAEQKNHCHRCIKAKARRSHPVKHAYYDLRTNAKRRGIEFNLSFEEFRAFAVKMDYVAGRGRTRDSYHIDRIDPTKGYTKDNIQTLSNQMNNYKKVLDYTVSEQKGFVANGTRLDVEPDYSQISMPF